MLDYDALNKLEKQYGNIKLVPEDNPLLSKLRKSAIGNEDDPQFRYPKTSATISHDDVVEIQYYWDHGIHNSQKIGRLMGHDHIWVTKRLAVMGLLSTIKHKRLSNAEQRRHYRNGSENHK
ncbi:hypothetical protein AYR62_15950 (plasmid) [Secundilactobacillus paracollinoides]|uniref:hypothetical protein n=1 Tax=Secundilactobacillus paracollinoides TaxID=240427 RepID=UPI00081A8C69|nr:hypothetical protein [Secundilactobacillus paracollinoides]ANZ65575.1 hypothetical protein AYR62_15950 [Secundilactobacillus paracollinoides]